MIFHGQSYNSIIQCLNGFDHDCRRTVLDIFPVFRQAHFHACMPSAVCLSVCDKDKTFFAFVSAKRQMEKMENRGKYDHVVIAVVRVCVAQHIYRVPNYCGRGRSPFIVAILRTSLTLHENGVSTLESVFTKLRFPRILGGGQNAKRK